MNIFVVAAFAFFYGGLALMELSNINSNLTDIKFILKEMKGEQNER